MATPPQLDKMAPAHVQGQEPVDKMPSVEREEHRAPLPPLTPLTPRGTRRPAGRTLAHPPSVKGTGGAQGRRVGMRGAVCPRIMLCCLVKLYGKLVW